MPTWHNVDLGEVVDLVAGFAFKSQRFTDKAGDMPLVKGENVSQGRTSGTSLNDGQRQNGRTLKSSTCSPAM
jgi:hypothetical protein